MRTIHAVWKDGRIVPTEPVDWPEGTALRVEPAEAPAAGLPDEDDLDLSGDSPEAIARQVAFYEALPKWEMTAEEEARWRADRQVMKEYTIARMKARDLEEGR